MTHIIQNMLGDIQPGRREVDSVVTHLYRLLNTHQALLKEEHATEEVDQLLEWLGRLSRVEYQLEKRVADKSIPLLQSLLDKLHQAADEQQHIVEESPSVASHSVEERSMELLETKAEVEDITVELLSLLHEPLMPYPATH